MFSIPDKRPVAGGRPPSVTFAHRDPSYVKTVGGETQASTDAQPAMIVPDAVQARVVNEEPE
jgi:hypothetical protein